MSAADRQGEHQGISFNMISGIINVYKQRGMTSHDVVYKMRKITGQKKIGHTGTLDPDAEGVLPVCLGSGTRLCELLGEGTKQYRAEMILGIRTDTQDMSGTILSKQEVTCTPEEIRAAAGRFTGEIEQIPPMYSAVKINGKKLYELARRGIEVERRSRKVFIGEILIEKIEIPSVQILVTCSRGTYIRTLCSDIGDALGCGASMSSLVRTRVGSFDLKDALTLGQIRDISDQGMLDRYVIRPDAFFPDAGAAKVSDEDQVRLLNGNPFPKRKLILMDDTGTWPERLRLYDRTDAFVGLYAWDNRGLYRPEKMFL